MRRLLLVGGGHAHLGVLRELARSRCRSSRSAPACISTRRPGLPWNSAGMCFDGEGIPFDAASLDVGSAGGTSFPLYGSFSAMPIRPLSRLVSSWPAVMERIGSQCTPFHLVIMGAGAAGVELAFAARHRGLRERWSHLHVALVGGSALPLEGAPEHARRLVMQLLDQRCIRWLGSRRATRIDGGQVEFGDGGSLSFDLCWIAAGAKAPQWLAPSGLSLDQEGFVRVNAFLQSLSHPHVFAAADVAAHSNDLPKSGVYAVRAGPALASSLRAYCTGRAFPSWKPGSRALNLLSTSDQRALALWGSWSWRGKWAWRWKDWIDRRFVPIALSRVE